MLPELEGRATVQTVGHKEGLEGGGRLNGIVPASAEIEPLLHEQIGAVGAHLSGRRIGVDGAGVEPEEKVVEGIRGERSNFAAVFAGEVDGKELTGGECACRQRPGRAFTVWSEQSWPYRSPQSQR